MGLENPINQISDLNSSWPLGGESKSSGDDHLRGIKKAIKSLLGAAGLMQLGFPDKSTMNGAVLVGDGTGFIKKTMAELKVLLGLENVANVDQQNASNLTSGTVPDARLPTNALGTRTVSSSSPTGGAENDIWFQY